MNLQTDNIRRIEKSEKRWRVLDYIRVGLGGIGGIAFFFIMIIMIVNEPYDHCEYVSKVTHMELYGVISSKVDRRWNHNNHGLNILKKDGTEHHLYLGPDLRLGKESRASYLWTIANEGDSIKKSRGTLNLYIKRGNNGWEKQPVVFATKQCP